MYNRITNPVTGRKVYINGKIGMRVIKNYLQELAFSQKGGAAPVVLGPDKKHTYHLLEKIDFVTKVNPGDKNAFEQKEDKFKKKFIKIYQNCFSLFKPSSQSIGDLFDLNKHATAVAGRCYIITDSINNLPIGFCFVNIISGSASIYSVCISKRYQRRGLCSLLMAEVISDVGWRNLYLDIRVAGELMSTCGLSGNMGACKCYEKHGFKVTNKECTLREDGLNCQMVRPANGTIFASVVTGPTFSCAESLGI